MSVIREVGTDRQLVVHVASQDEPTEWMSIGREDLEEPSSSVVMSQMNLAIGTNL